MRNVKKLKHMWLWELPSVGGKKDEEMGVLLASDLLVLCRLLVALMTSSRNCVEGILTLMMSLLAAFLGNQLMC